MKKKNVPQYFPVPLTIKDVRDQYFKFMKDRNDQSRDFPPTCNIWTVNKLFIIAVQEDDKGHYYKVTIDGQIIYTSPERFKNAVTTERAAREKLAKLAENPKVWAS